VQVLIFALAASAIPATLGIAMLRYRLFDIDILINRTLVWALLTAFVFGVYFLIVGYIGTLLRWQDSPALSLIVVGIITIAFQPLRVQVQRGVNRLMYGQRDEPYAVMTQLGQRLQATLSADAVFQTIVEMTAKALRLPYAALYLHNDGQPICCAEWISATAQREVVVANPITLPVTYQGATVAELRLVPRQRNENFSSADWVLLNDLARQAGSAIHAVQLTHDLQRSRERIVTAREEERRRLRRDLHDGLGPALAAQTLQLDAVLDLLETSPQAARHLLSRIKLQTQDVVADVRRLMYDLRPPALDELGVGGAISNFADSITTVQCDVHVSDDVPPLPAAVEVAGYRIATEAITNVVKHAHAQTCVVHIQIEDQRWLIIEVCDNGSGLPSTHQIGVGLRSMRERAEELGGTLRIESASGAGTRVCARLPIVDRDGAGLQRHN
jgi:signal transduction histidine kinase